MSLLIHSMELPKSYHDIRIYADGRIVSKSLRTFGEEIATAVIILPHGRLIDADALWVEINKICDRRDAGIITDLTCISQILSALRHAPTIIEAEEDERWMARN